MPAEPEWHNPGDCDAGYTEVHPAFYCGRPRRRPAPQAALFVLLGDRSAAVEHIALLIARQTHQLGCDSGSCKITVTPQARKLASRVLDDLLSVGRR